MAFGAPRSARAQATATVSAAASFALIVGSNAPGPGQQELRYAEQDAAAMTAVLRDVGGYPAANVVTALRPDRAGLLAAVASLRERVQRQTGRGEQAQLLFYYSGHARADAITLGREEIPLGELRQQILGLPSTLTIVVIDACQSGAFSRIKGAEATTDFSFNIGGAAGHGGPGGHGVEQRDRAESGVRPAGVVVLHASSVAGAARRRRRQPGRQGQPGRGLPVHVQPNAGGDRRHRRRGAARDAGDRAQGQR